MPIGEIIGEPLKIQKLGNKDEIKEKVLNMLDIVGLVRDFYDKYPFEMLRRPEAESGDCQGADLKTGTDRVR